MGEPLQRVFMIFVRPGAVMNGSFATFTTAYELVKAASGQPGTDDREEAVYSPAIAKHIITDPPTPTETLSNGYHNSSKRYTNDPWMLHSTYTSYEDFMINLTTLLSIYPASMILSTSYIPTGFIVTPFE